MTELQEVIHKVTAIKSRLQEEYKINAIGMFGSVLRGESKDTSDVDFLVELDLEADLLDMIGLSQFLEEYLQCRVDVVPRSALRPELRQRILEEVKFL